MSFGIVKLERAYFSLKGFFLKDLQARSQCQSLFPNLNFSSFRETDFS